MNKEEKELLLKDLCARLPYGVKIYNHLGQISTFYGIKENFIFVPRCVRYGISYDDVDVENIKPYLRPISSMTEDEKKYLLKIGFDVFDDDFDNQVSVDDIAYIDKDCFNDTLDFLLKHHIDFRGLIEKGLALEAPKDMYKS